MARREVYGSWMWDDASPSARPGLSGLRRSRQHRVIAGVCGGLGGYLGVDPVLLRLAFLVLGLSGLGIPLYLIGWLVIPKQRRGEEVERGPGDGAGARVVAGLALVVFGLILLVRHFVPWFGTGLLWPFVLLALGVALLARPARRAR